MNKCNLDLHIFIYRLHDCLTFFYICVFAFSCSDIGVTVDTYKVVVMRGANFQNAFCAGLRQCFDYSHTLRQWMVLQVAIN